MKKDYGDWLTSYSYCMMSPDMDYTKDYIEKIDFQDIFIAVVNWPIAEFYVAFVCIIRLFG